MRRTHFLLAGLLLSLVSFGSDSAKDYDDNTEAVSIEGTWLRTGAVYHGSKVDFPYQTVLVFQEGTWTQKDTNGYTQHGTYRIKPTCKPPQLDMTWSTGNTLMWICRVDGKTLKMAGSADERPRRFDGDGHVIETYRRVK